MGWGDELMAAGEARSFAQGKVRVLGVNGVQRWHPMWEGNPRIARIGERHDWTIVNGPHCRPYIAGKDAERWRWKAYQPTPGEIVFSDAEIEIGKRAAGAVLIEPGVKHRDGNNKDWGFRNWQRVVQRVRGVRWVQVGDAEARRLDGVQFIGTGDFRQAAAVLANCRAAVLPEGGLHHAAAALAVPAVVVFGGFISPAVTGYKWHRNLYVEASPWPLGCGARSRCQHCRNAMGAISVPRVIEELEAIL